VHTDDPLWPVVLETSRQILRREDLHLRIPQQYKNDMEGILLEISDYQPGRLEFPTFETLQCNDVCIFVKEKENLRMIAYIGTNEPNEKVRWIKMDVEPGWKEVVIVCNELHVAGYPGCVGCGGPNSEMPWDEEKSRSGLL
tara:strand:+ start:26423 stop:26845 length:423 start_codon:yes stop_codon:yes gene_type:complete